MHNPNIHILLTHLKNVKEKEDGVWTSYCPLHESGPGNHNNSLSIAASDDGKIMVNCHNGCDAKEIIYASGLTWTDCFPPRKNEPSSKITASYDYFDEEGVLRFQVCRIEPGKDGRKKDFRQRQPDGSGGWTWKTSGLKKFPYRLKEVAVALKGTPILIVEGEKQVDYLISKGFVATCNPGGAGKWLKSYAKYFKNRDCIIIPDADLPNEKTGKIVGAAHAKDVADSLLGEAQSIHVIELPNCKPKWGFDDWLEAGNTREDFGKLCEVAKPWSPESDLITMVPLAGQTPEEMADPLKSSRDILEECGIIYVAQNEKNGKVEIFSNATQKFSQVATPSKLAYEDLVLAGGLLITQKVMRNADDNTGDYSMSQIKCAIAAIASQNSVVEDKLGVGVWENNGCLVVVNSRELGILNGQPELQITRNPVHFGLAYDIGDRCDWIKLSDLQSDIASVKAKPGELYVNEVFATQALFSKWNYMAPGNIFPEVLTGMLMATYMQTLWNWRPQVFVTGQAYSGKSTMLKMIARILGPLCKMSSNSSAAGIRQSIGSSSRIVLCDELEKSRYRTEILEMIRASGRGDDSFRGTAGHQAVAFKLQHIFWCASIESGLTTEADQSRFIVAELRKVDDRMILPTHDELEALGKKLAIVAITSFRRAKEMAEFLLEHKPADVHGRICESYAVPISMYAASIGMSDTEGLKLYLAALEAISESESIDSDSESLLQEILVSKVRTAGNIDKSVIHMIRDRITHQHDETLEHNGIYITDEHFLLNRKLILRYLLPTDWKGKRIDTILMRLPGAERVKKSFGGSQIRFVAIPRKHIEDIDLNPDRAPSFEEQSKNPLSF